VFITFEGIEGCGKSTQSRRLYARLNSLKISAILTVEPGGTQIGQDIRKILLDSNNQNLSPLAELLLYAADRVQHVTEVVIPALQQGAWVVCDRFFDATTVYQGYGRHLDLSLIHLLNTKATYGIMPDLTILVDCPVEVGLKRAMERNRIMQQEKQARFEEEKTKFHETVRQGYLEIASREPERVIVVDGTLDRDALETVIFAHIKPRLNPEKG
jgi:dTMP kinase